MATNINNIQDLSMQEVEKRIAKIENNNVNNHTHDHQKVNVEEEEEKDKSITVADIIGEFGPYQLSITLLAFIRYICVAMMTSTGPLIAPSVEYFCLLPSNSSIATLIVKPDNVTVDEYLKGKCELNLTNGSLFECSSWRYNNSQYGITLTDSFNLVCDRDWLRSIFQSAVSVGVVVAAIVWGSFSDRHGRNFTIKICFLCSLISGLLSYLANNFLIYTISRSLCSFSDLGLVVSLSTIIVESLGTKYRGSICILIYTGWSFGVMIMPWLVDYLRDYKQLMLVTLILHIFTLPWLMTINESVRWSLINGNIEEAREELRRISKWNSKGDETMLAIVDEKFNNIKSKFVLMAVRRENENVNMKSSRWKIVCLSTFGGLSKVNQLFHSRWLVITTIALVWTTFNSELLYMLFIMINSDIGDNIKLNYALGGIMEILATIISIIIISNVTRKFSLVSTLISISCLSFILAFTYQYPSTSVWILNLTKLAISTLSSLIYVTTTEVFPTNLRQTGIGIAGTLGSLGAVVAPFIRTQLVDLIGMTNMLLIIVILPFTAAAIIPFFLRETKGIELSDDVDEIEENYLLNLDVEVAASQNEKTQSD